MSAADLLDAMAGRSSRPSAPHERLQVLRATLRVWRMAPAGLRPDVDHIACRIAASLDYLGRVEASALLADLASAGSLPDRLAALLRAEDPGLFDALAAPACRPAPSLDIPARLAA